MVEKDRSDIDNVDRESGAEAGAEARARSEARRRVLTAGLAGAPLILTLTSRPAFAGHCTYSGMTSGNLSTTHDIVCQGKTPGFWKTHEQQVLDMGIFVGTCNPITEDGGQCEDYSVPKKEELEAYIEHLIQENKKKNDSKKIGRAHV